MATAISSEPHLETICRLCLQPDKGSINIFQSQLSIPVRIMACAALEVRASDGLPSLICEKCRYHLEVSYYFRKTCQISDSKLRKHIRLLNAGKRSRVFLKSNEEDESDEQQFQCKESIKFIEAEDLRKKAEEAEKNQKWFEEQREQLRREDTKRLLEKFTMFMQSHKNKKRMNSSSIPTNTTNQASTTKGRTSTNTKRERIPPPIRHLPQKVELQDVPNVPMKVAFPIKLEQGQQLQQQYQQEQKPQLEVDADNDITSSEQIPEDKQENEEDQEQTSYYRDDVGEGENSEMLIFENKNNDGDNEIIQIEVDDDAEIVETMSQGEEEGVSEGANDENEMESKVKNETDVIDEFISLADFGDFYNGVDQPDRVTEVESYQNEENGDIQYFKEERSQEDENNSNQHDNSSASKFIIEDLTNEENGDIQYFREERSQEDENYSNQHDNSSTTKFIIEDVTSRLQKLRDNAPVEMEKNKKHTKIQIPVISKVVTLVNEKFSTDNLKIFKCNDCTQSFTRVHSLLRHRSVHKGRSDYFCNHCGRFFSTKGSLDRHHRIHTGEEPFTCNQCGKDFNKKCVLIRHMTIHTGEHSHQCPHCLRWFGKKLLMNQHINALHVVRQFTKNTCHLCPKSFLHHSELSRHLSTHMEMLFPCPVCDRVYIDKSSLRRHFTGVHNKHE